MINLAPGTDTEKLAEWIRESKNVVVFSGAGISTESGVSDFRSPGGIWERFDPSELSYPNFISSPESRKKYWQLYREIWKESSAAQPNRAHLVVAELENKYEKIAAVITQNIDGLHQKAGNSPQKVYEFHGTMWEVKCLSCGKSYAWEDIFHQLEREGAPEPCEECGGLLKPATVSFGQSLPADVLREAQQQSQNCDLFISVGSSLVVYPAAYMPEVAKKSGARLVIINRDPTPLDSIADLVIQRQLGEAMSEVLDYLGDNF